MKYNDQTILNYLEAIDQKENIRGMIDGNCFWRGCVISMLMSKYSIPLLRAYDILYKFTGNEYYEKGEFLIAIRDRYLDDHPKKGWQFTTKENAYRFLTRDEAIKAKECLDPYNRPHAEVIHDQNTISTNHS